MRKNIFLNLSRAVIDFKITPDEFCSLVSDNYKIDLSNSSYYSINIVKTIIFSEVDKITITPNIILLAIDKYKSGVWSKIDLSKWAFILLSLKTVIGLKYLLSSQDEIDALLDVIETISSGPALIPEDQYDNIIEELITELETISKHR